LRRGRRLWCGDDRTRHGGALGYAFSLSHNTNRTHTPRPPFPLPQKSKAGPAPARSGAVAKGAAAKDAVAGRKRGAAEAVGDDDEEDEDEEDDKEEDDEDKDEDGEDDGEDDGGKKAAEEDDEEAGFKGGKKGKRKAKKAKKAGQSKPPKPPLNDDQKAILGVWGARHEGGKARKAKVRFSVEEDEALVQLVKEKRTAISIPWSQILFLGWKTFGANERIQTDLKDRWRNLTATKGEGLVTAKVRVVGAETRGFR
jgi:hypothetical protein